MTFKLNESTLPISTMHRSQSTETKAKRASRKEVREETERDRAIQREGRQEDN